MRDAGLLTRLKHMVLMMSLVVLTVRRMVTEVAPVTEGPLLSEELLYVVMHSPSGALTFAPKLVVRCHDTRKIDLKMC